MKTTFKLTGFKELEKALAEELPKATAKNVLRRSGIAVMERRIEARARELAPRERGELQDGITTKAVRAKRQRGGRYERSSGVEIATGPTGNPKGGNAAWQEDGTVNMPANPYMRPAADAEGENVIGDVREELAARIDKAKARIAKRAARKRK